MGSTVDKTINLTTIASTLSRNRNDREESTLTIKATGPNSNHIQEAICTRQSANHTYSKYLHRMEWHFSIGALYSKHTWDDHKYVIYIYIIQILCVCLSVKYRRPNCWTDHDQNWHAYADRPGNGSYQILAP